MTGSTRAFPPARGKDLEGNEVTIPRDLHKPYNLLLVAFQQWQQGMINGWVEFLQEVKATSQVFDFYEIPTLNAL